MTDTPEPSTDALEILQSQLNQSRQHLKRAELKSLAIRAGIIDVEGLKLLDTSKLTIDDDGTVVGAATLVDQFKRDKPWLFPAPARSNSSHPAEPPQAEAPKTRTAKDMSYAEWRQARERLLKKR
jgi:hypothetical protein